MNALTTETVRCRARRPGAIWRPRCGLDAIHVIDGGRAHWAGDSVWWAIAESERMTETEQRTYDFLTSEPGPLNHETALIHIATIRDLRWMQSRAASMAMFTGLTLLAFVLVLFFWGHG